MLAKASPVGPLLLVTLSTVAGCGRARALHWEPVASVDASAGAPSSVATVPASAFASAAPTGVRSGACTPDPARGFVVPDSARAVDVRMAASGAKALVTYWETKKRGDGPDLETAYAQVFDALTSTVGSRIKLEENGFGDEPVSGAVPLAAGGDVVAISCAWAAPAGRYACARSKPGDKSSSLFAFSGISNGGPEKHEIAAVVKGDDAIVVVPVGGDLHLFASPVSAKKKDSPFALRMSPDPYRAAEALTATLSADDEATIVYRHDGAVRARRAGFDEKWRGKPIDLSAKGALVGAPAVASEPGHVVAVFAQRTKASDPWRVVVADLSAAGDVKTSELPTGSEQAYGPGLARTAEPGCFAVSWVEGSGKNTRTKLARACQGAIAPSSVTTLSTEGVEGGRAYLAADPTTPSSLFAAWQEIPPGKPAKLRVAKLTCR